MKVQTDLRTTYVDCLKGWVGLEEVPHPEGAPYVALKTSEGKFKTLNPQGEWSPTDATIADGWERFIPDGGVYLAPRNDAGTQRVHAVLRNAVACPPQS